MKHTKIDILILDDDPDAIEVLEHILGRAGYSVTAISNSSTALDLLTERTFHIMILDLKLPAMDGLSVLKAIRERDRDLAVIVLTGFPSVESAVASLKGGVSDYVEKPIDEGRLLGAVQAVVAAKGLLCSSEESLLRAIGQKLRAERKARDLTLKQVARRTGLSVSLLSQIERAESAASVSSLYKIATALGTRLEELFGGL